MSENNLASKFYEGKPCMKCGSTTRYIKGYKRCVNCRRKQGRNWLRENSKTAYEQVQKWRQANPEKVREQNRKWKKSNPEKVHVNDQNWRKNNYKRYLEIQQTSQIKTRAKRALAEGSHTTQEWINLKEQYGNRCLCCGRHQSELDRVLEQDHIIPLSRSGTNWISNIQPLCHDCNGMGHKGTKTVDYRILFISCHRHFRHR